MASHFVGSMVSIDCGDVLGIYQGLLDAVDSSKQMLTIVSAFRNGVKCSVPRITLNASDIHDLKIVKDAAEAKNYLAVVNKHVKHLPDGLPMTSTPENGKRPSPQTCDESVVSFHRSPSDVESTAVAAGDSCANAPNMATLTVQKNGVATAAAIAPGKQKRSNGSSSYTSVSPCKLNGISRNCSSGRLRSAAKSNASEVTLNHRPNSLMDVGDCLPSFDEQFTKKNGQAMLDNNKNNLFRKRTNSASELYSVVTRNGGGWKATTAAGPRTERHAGRGAHGGVREQEDCFAVPVDTFAEDEFDFEKNLALFDKQAVFHQIDRDRELSNGISALSTGGPSNSSPRPCEMKYRCDENVLPVRKAVYRQILLVDDKSTSSSTAAVREYVTDSGLVVPSVSAELRARLFELAERSGYDRRRCFEMIGRSAAEMVLQLLGGGSRFDPKNMHQRPCVAVMCGSGSRSAVAVNCARYLAGRGIRVTLFVPDSILLDSDVAAEMKLLNFCDGIVKTSNCSDLPTKPVDMIVSALDGCDTDSSKVAAWYQPVVDWSNSNKAPVLSIDPPPGKVAIVAKYSLAIALPLAFDSGCGQIYLCDLGLPARLFQDAGIKKYQSPFAHKFVIPLYAAKKGFNVRSFGSGINVKLPGVSADRPNIYDFSTTYDEMYKDLKAKDPQLYTQNGILHMLDRNRRIKPKPERFQLCKEHFDVVVTCEERVYDQVVEDLESREKSEPEPTHIINIDIQDNPEEATIGAFMICDLCSLLAQTDDLDNDIDELLQEFEARCQRSILHTVIFY